MWSKCLFILFFSLYINTSFSSSDLLTQKEIINIKVKGSYQHVYDSVISSILGRGLSIAHEDDAAISLKNFSTQTRSIFTNAKIISFCSAELSQQLVLENPHFIVLCPFSINVYELNSEKDIIYISYRNPTSLKPTSRLLKKVNNLYQSIIENSITWFATL